MLEQLPMELGKLPCNELIAMFSERNLHPSVNMPGEILPVRLLLLALNCLSLSMPGQTMPVKPFQLRSTCLSFGQPSNSLSILPVKLLLETLRKVRLPHIPGKFLSILP
ncbi:Os08g0322550 [Oryza sativa Japonica Group]|uniref:Os08g0322550 protein n=1 Tax=Oryza sativa subsp. japonica TaxID=39947 RepID=A0A0P0XEM0_ORYSJ|nr:hypothetical protein EE612_043469 [Oryza sativa]BAT04879.1 Os08g0322550 [Oryza sativa Japonica Group]